MEIFQTIWTALSTPNPTLINYLMLPFIFIENSLTMLLFTTLFKVNPTKKQILSYIFILSIVGIITNLFIPTPYGTYINIIVMISAIMIIFKVNILKSIITIFIPLILTVLLESVIVPIYSTIFNLDYQYGMTIPLHRIIGISIVYLIVATIYLSMRNFKIHLRYLDELDFKTKSSYIITCILSILVLYSQLYIITFYMSNLPTSICILTTIGLLLYLFISIYSLTRTTKLAIVNQDLEQTKLYNNTLQILHDNMRSFKHDFANIVQAIGRVCRY